VLGLVYVKIFSFLSSLFRFSSVISVALCTFFLFLVSASSLIGKFVSKMIYTVLSRTLNSTHLLTYCAP